MSVSDENRLAAKLREAAQRGSARIQEGNLIIEDRGKAPTSVTFAQEGVMLERVIRDRRTRSAPVGTTGQIRVLYSVKRMANPNVKGAPQEDERWLCVGGYQKSYKDVVVKKISWKTPLWHASIDSLPSGEWSVNLCYGGQKIGTDRIYERLSSAKGDEFNWKYQAFVERFSAHVSSEDGESDFQIPIHLCAYDAPTLKGLFQESLLIGSVDAKGNKYAIAGESIESVDSSDNSQERGWVDSRADEHFRSKGFGLWHVGIKNPGQGIVPIYGDGITSPVVIPVPPVLPPAQEAYYIGCTIVGTEYAGTYAPLPPTITLSLYNNGNPGIFVRFPNHPTWSMYGTLASGTGYILRTNQFFCAQDVNRLTAYDFSGKTDTGIVYESYAKMYIVDSNVSPTFPANIIGSITIGAYHYVSRLFPPPDLIQDNCGFVCTSVYSDGPQGMTNYISQRTDTAIVVPNARCDPYTGGPYTGTVPPFLNPSPKPVPPTQPRIGTITIRSYDVVQLRNGYTSPAHASMTNKTIGNSSSTTTEMLSGGAFGFPDRQQQIDYQATFTQMEKPVGSIATLFRVNPDHTGGLGFYNNIADQPAAAPFDQGKVHLTWINPAALDATKEVPESFLNEKSKQIEYKYGDLIAYAWDVQANGFSRIDLGKPRLYLSSDELSGVAARSSKPDLLSSLRASSLGSINSPEHVGVPTGIRTKDATVKVQRFNKQMGRVGSEIEVPVFKLTISSSVYGISKYLADDPTTWDFYCHDLSYGPS